MRIHAQGSSRVPSSVIIHTWFEIVHKLLALLVFVTFYEHQNPRPDDDD